MSSNSFGLNLGQYFALANDRGASFYCVAGVISVRVWAIAAIAYLGFVGISLANPLDSPGTVYIEGVPCNLHCQSYMAWSRQTLRANQAAARGAVNTSVAKASAESPHKRISRRAEPTSADVAPRKKKIGDLQAAFIPPETLPLPRPRIEAAPLNENTRAPPAPLSTAPEPPSVSTSGTEGVPLAAETSNPPRERSPQELIMAALAVAEQITTAETSKASENDRTDETKVGNVSAPLVALLLSRPDVKSAAALKGLSVAIDTAQSAVEQNVRLALAAVGATDTQLSVSDVSPLDRLISGDTQAAFVKLVSPDAAESFPDIKGFKVLRVPLPPH
jgi:hypothetical protein